MVDGITEKVALSLTYDDYIGVFGNNIILRFGFRLNLNMIEPFPDAANQFFQSGRSHLKIRKITFSFRFCL